MLKKIIDYCKNRTWPRILAAALLIVVCWTLWWFLGRTPFTPAQEKPQTTVSAQQKKPAKKDSKKDASTTQEDVNEWVRGLDKRMNAVYTEKTIDDTTIQDLIEHSRGQDHTIGDNVEAVDDLETNLSNKCKEYTLSSDTRGRTPAQKLDDLESTFAQWKDAVYFTAWRDIYNTQVNRSYDAYEYALKGIVKEDLPEQCQKYQTEYFSAMPDFDESMSNRKKLDFFKKWYSSYEKSLYQCLSHPNKQMSRNMMAGSSSDSDSDGQ